jgi:hypothetical protein
VVRGDDLDLEAQLPYLGDLPLDELAEGHEYVGVVVDHRVFQLRHGGAGGKVVVEAGRRGDMLAKASWLKRTFSSGI